MDKNEKLFDGFDVFLPVRILYLCEVLPGFSGPSTKTEPCNLAPCAYPKNSCCNNYKPRAINSQIVCTNGQTEVSTTSTPETTCPSITTTVSGVCCPTGGMWSEWSASGSCSDTCGGFGYGTYTRTCLTGSNCPCG